MAIDSAVTMKRILRFAIGLLVNVFILFILVKVFAFGFSFAYDVFASNSCKDKSDTKVVTVTVLLQHDLRQPYMIRFFIFSPWKISGMLRIPCDQIVRDLLIYILHKLIPSCCVFVFYLYQ